MSKRSIITISIITGILAVLLVLFGLVFCVRTQRVDFVGERAETLDITDEEIISSANIRRGKSIFLLDKDRAIANIESEYPYLKVIQIKTTSPISIEIRVRERVAMYYAKYNENYFILDEDLKVLQVSAIEPSLTHLNTNALGITNSTRVGSFVGTDSHRTAMYNLFIAMYNTAKIDGKYLERADIQSFMLEISYDTGYTLTKSYDRLIIKTSYGVTLDIAEPTINTEYKVNVLMSAFNELEDSKRTTGTLKYYFNSTDEAKAGYFE